MDGPGTYGRLPWKGSSKDASGTAAEDTISIGSGDRVSGADRMGMEVHLSISVHLGAALVQNRTILSGLHGYTATVEHIPFVPRGKKCYCGKIGCLETVCSMDALLEDEEEDVFFEKLNEGVSVPLIS